jgi:hypothetical protein
VRRLAIGAALLVALAFVGCSGGADEPAAPTAAPASNLTTSRAQLDACRELLDVVTVVNAAFKEPNDAAGVVVLEEAKQMLRGQDYPPLADAYVWMELMIGYDIQAFSTTNNTVSLAAFELAYEALETFNAHMKAGCGW